MTFKLGVLAYKCIHHQAPIYLARMCVNVATNPALATHRSAAQGRLVVPAANMKTVGHRGFYFACPTPLSVNKVQFSEQECFNKSPERRLSE